jgi:hypothetical protein
MGDEIEGSPSSDYERGHTDGERAALVGLLGHVLGRLGYDDIAARQAWWVKERESAIATLRELCRDFGDNDWPEDLHLTDIIGKHLADHLHGG